MLRPFPLPISVRLALWYGLTLFLLLSGFAVFCYTGFHLALHRDFDRHLTHEHRELLPYVASGAEGPRFEGLDQLTSVAYRTDGVYGTYVRLLTPDGSTRYTSPNFEDHAPLPLYLPDNAEEVSVSRTWEGLPARTRFVPLFAGDQHRGWLEVTGLEWSMHRELHRLAWMLSLGVFLSVGLALAGGWWLARRALLPVAAMTAAAKEMGTRDLSERLPADFGVHDELTELAETFNRLLVRLEASVARERRFTANAAHELLTPLATLRSEAEVALRRERSPEAYQNALLRLMEDIERMTATVQGLLMLARAEALNKQPEDRFDLTSLVLERVSKLRPELDAKEFAVDLTVAPGVVIAAQQAPLIDVVDNLLINAAKYTPKGGLLRIALTHRGGEAVLEIEDSGVGFDRETGERLFDRFYRSDDPEIQAEPGTGLGLAIVRAITEAYGGSVEAFSPGPGHGARMTVRLPCLACKPSSV